MTSNSLNVSLKDVTVMSPISRSPRSPLPISRAVSPGLRNTIRTGSLCGESPPNSSQFYEVLFVGKVRASHKRAPRSFIDEALKKFSEKNAKKAEDSVGDSTIKNRTMLLQVGKSQLRLISPEKRQVLIHKSYREISHCSPGISSSDHFGFISREVAGGYIAYVFKCDSKSVVKDILHGIGAAFQVSSGGNTRVCNSVSEGVGGNMTDVARKARRSLADGFNGLINLGKLSIDNVEEKAPIPSLHIKCATPLKTVEEGKEELSNDQHSTESSFVVVSPSKMAPLTPGRQFNFQCQVSPNKEEREEECVKSPRLQIFSKTEHRNSEGEVGARRRLHIFEQVEIKHCIESGSECKNFRLLWRKVIKQIVTLNRLERECERVAQEEKFVEEQIKLDYTDIFNVTETNNSVWEKLLSKGSSYELEDLTEGVVIGVDKSVRGKVWQFLAQVSDKDDNYQLKRDSPANPQKRSYMELKSLLTSHQHSILIDLGRTFPDHEYFSGALGLGQLGMFNMLKAYSNLDPEVGYCQGLPFMVGLLLMHQDEEAAFHLLRHLMFTEGLRAQFHPSMNGLRRSLYQLTRLLSDSSPALYNHLNRLQMDPSLYATPWLLTLFATHFPLGFVARVFDLLFLDGFRSVLKVAVALLLDHKDELLATTTLEQLMNVLNVTIPKLPADRLEIIIKKAVNMDVNKLIFTYEVEYEVLQEENYSKRQKDEEHKREVDLLTCRLSELTEELSESDKTISSLTKQLEMKNRRIADLSVYRKGA